MRRSAHQPGGEPVESLDVIGWAEPGTRAEVCVEAERAARAVARLRPEQQKVLELGILAGLSHSEIAAATGMPLGTVKTNMRRGLLQVRELMDVVVEEAAGGVQP
jgi:RNA polymerase sigma-70 factor (ECF subfamily)